VLKLIINIKVLSYIVVGGRSMGNIASLGDGCDEAQGNGELQILSIIVMCWKEKLNFCTLRDIMFVVVCWSAAV
jgi:hypothetical protein